ncbi:phosphatase PAP2 family protein [Chitinophaga filiformis]|uniref:phosphatase PAP2 family protein n=1 Tax=Chitinophaga filiformis TaxID=104663 RepID=UPI001F36C1E8|nr:phosphatase PAP2 family protein [Chitinophaga filiformis]MCF6405576.1 phosphatase PAP2 family protein [Chitinophaga filiformis]
MLERLLRLDYKLFFYINNVWRNSVLDAIIPWLREPYVWAPVYLFLLLFVTINYGWKGFWWIVFFLVTFGLADQSSLHIKELVGRIRPCRDPLMQHFVRVLVVYCPGSGSFTSSHAANHFALSTFCFLTFRHISKLYASLFFVWALAVCYAQVYVGVHYPLDVIGGGVLGIMIGTLSAGFFQRRIRLEPELTT